MATTPTDQNKAKLNDLKVRAWNELRSIDRRNQANQKSEVTVRQLNGEIEKLEAEIDGEPIPEGGEDAQK